MATVLRRADSSRIGPSSLRRLERAPSSENRRGQRAFVVGPFCSSYYTKGVVIQQCCPSLAPLRVPRGVIERLFTGQELAGFLFACGATQRIAFGPWEKSRSSDSCLQRKCGRHFLATPRCLRGFKTLRGCCGSMPESRTSRSGKRLTRPCGASESLRTTKAE